MQDAGSTTVREITIRPLHEVRARGFRCAPYLLSSTLLFGSVVARAQQPPSEPSAADSEEELEVEAAADSPLPPPPADEGAPGTLTKAPKLLVFVEAALPQSETADQTASVLLELLITDQGLVQDARVVESGGAGFDAAALAAVRGFVFEPAEVDGKPAAVKIQYRYEFQAERPESTETTLEGEVRDGATGQPIAGVAVRLDTGEVATTDAAGRFSFQGLTPGERTILLSGADLAALQTTETLAPGDRVKVRYDVTLRALGSESSDVADDLEMLIVAPKPTFEVVSTRVEAESARRVAGTQGDVLKVVENMPGVARAAVGSGDVIVWGAAPQDTRVYVDEVRVPALYHFGGFRSVVHSDLVRSVELIPGGYGASYGRGLGGLVTVETSDPPADEMQGSVQVDVLDAAAAARGPLSERLRYSVAARRSHLHQVLAGVYDAEDRSFLPIPEYFDASARLSLQTDTSEWFELGGMLSGDAISRGVSSDDPLSRSREDRELSFDRVFFRYRNEPGDGSRVSFTPWFGRDRTRLRTLFAEVPSRLDGDALLFGLRSKWSGPLARGVIAVFGLDVEVAHSTLHRIGSMGAPPREGDVRVFGQPPSDQVNADRWKALAGSAAPYAEADIALFGERVHLTPGLRVEPFLASINRRQPESGNGADVGAFDAELSLQPRLAARYAPHPAVTLKAAYGRYRQPAQAEDLSAVFGNPLLGTAEATHYLVGGDVRLGGHFGVEAMLFHARSEDLPVRNPLPSPRVAEALVPTGEGRSYGLQVLVRRELADGFFGWIAYTLLQSERRDGEDERWRLFDYDQTHVLTTLASYDLGKRFEIGARMRAATGYPRTPVLDAYYDSRRDQFEPILGEHNADRVPAFWQVDARVSKRWSLAATELEVYLDLLNVTNTENAEEIAYSADYTQRRFINGLPFLPVLGARWEY